MKRIVSLLAITVMALSVVACGNNPPAFKQGGSNSGKDAGGTILELPLSK